MGWADLSEAEGEVGEGEVSAGEPVRHGETPLGVQIIDARSQRVPDQGTQVPASSLKSKLTTLFYTHMDNGYKDG